MTAFFFYFLVNIQGAFEALQPFNKLTHFTNFVVAHAHLALLGAFTILGMGSSTTWSPRSTSGRCGAAASPSGSTGSSRSGSPASSAS